MRFFLLILLFINSIYSYESCKDLNQDILSSKFFNQKNYRSCIEDQIVDACACKDTYSDNSLASNIIKPLNETLKKLEKDALREYYARSFENKFYSLIDRASYLDTRLDSSHLKSVDLYRAPKCNAKNALEGIGGALSNKNCKNGALLDSLNRSFGKLSDSEFKSVDEALSFLKKKMIKVVNPIFENKPQKENQCLSFKAYTALTKPVKKVSTHFVYDITYLGKKITDKFQMDYYKADTKIDYLTKIESEYQIRNQMMNRKSSFKGHFNSEWEKESFEKASTQAMLSNLDLSSRPDLAIILSDEELRKDLKDVIAREMASMADNDGGFTNSSMSFGRYSGIVDEFLLNKKSDVFQKLDDDCGQFFNSDNIAKALCEPPPLSKEQYMKHIAPIVAEKAREHDLELATVFPQRVNKLFCDKLIGGEKKVDPSPVRDQIYSADYEYVPEIANLFYEKESAYDLFNEKFCPMLEKLKTSKEPLSLDEYKETLSKVLENQDPNFLKNYELFKTRGMVKDQAVTDPLNFQVMTALKSFEEKYPKDGIGKCERIIPADGGNDDGVDDCKKATLLSGVNFGKVFEPAEKGKEGGWFLNYTTTATKEDEENATENQKVIARADREGREVKESELKNVFQRRDAQTGEILRPVVRVTPAPPPPPPRETPVPPTTIGNNNSGSDSSSKKEKEFVNNNSASNVPKESKKLDIGKNEDSSNSVSSSNRRESEFKGWDNTESIKNQISDLEDSANDNEKKLKDAKDWKNYSRNDSINRTARNELANEKFNSNSGSFSQSGNNSNVRGGSFSGTSGASSFASGGMGGESGGASSFYGEPVDETEKTSTFSGGKNENGKGRAPASATGSSGGKAQGLPSNVAGLKSLGKNKNKKIDTLKFPYIYPYIIPHSKLRRWSHDENNPFEFVIHLGLYGKTFATVELIKKINKATKSEEVVRLVRFYDFYSPFDTISFKAGTPEYNKEKKKHDRQFESREGRLKILKHAQCFKLSSKKKSLENMARKTTLKSTLEYSRVAYEQHVKSLYREMNEKIYLSEALASKSLEYSKFKKDRKVAQGCQ